MFTGVLKYLAVANGAILFVLFYKARGTNTQIGCKLDMTRGGSMRLQRPLAIS